MVIENPYQAPNYLAMFFPIKPKVIINDRYAEGDYYKKPTQFFFINCEPEQNVNFEPIEFVNLLKIKYLNKESCIDNDISRQVQRSLIHPQFVERFLKTYILTKEDGLWI